jgi:hypothetical protein
VIRYGLDSLGFEPWWGQFLHLSRPTPRPTLEWVLGLFAWGKAPPTPSSAEVKESIELYLYTPSGPSWPILG